MTQNSDFLERIFGEQTQASSERYLKLGLRFNPFPRSGTANINGSDLLNRELIPVDENVKTQIAEFIRDALNANEIDNTDKFLSATITGDYGSGKTQLLMFIKYVLGEVAVLHEGLKNPYVIYVDNPRVKLLEFIGSIILKVGEENFKKFIWSKVIQRIKASPNHRARLARFQSKGVLFHDTDPDPYAPENTVSYKQFLNSFTRYIGTPRDRKEFDEALREVLTRILEGEVEDSVLAEYFYELISDDYGVNKTWEALSTGTIKQLDKKLVAIVRYVVRLVKEQGYTDFFILVDEFEDITQGRLSKSQVDNYVYNLRTLLDEHREWCLVFAMTSEALRKLRSVSPPLADRISTRVVRLSNLTNNDATRIAKNYLTLARDVSTDDLIPFDISGVERLNALVEGNARRFLQTCYYMVEKAADELDSGAHIDSQFIAANSAQASP